MTFRFFSSMQRAHAVVLMVAWTVPLCSAVSFAQAVHTDTGGAITSDAPQISAAQSALPLNDAAAASLQQSEETPSRETSTVPAEAALPASVARDAGANPLPSDVATPAALFLAPADVAAAVSEAGGVSVSDEIAPLIPIESAATSSRNLPTDNTDLGDPLQPQKALPRPLVSSLQQLLALKNHVLMELQKHGIGKPVADVINRQPKNEPLKLAAVPPVTASALVAARGPVASAVSFAPAAVRNTRPDHLFRLNARLAAAGMVSAGIVGWIGWYFMRRRAASIGSAVRRRGKDDSGVACTGKTLAPAAASSPEFSREAIARLNDLDMSLPPRVVSMRLPAKASQRSLMHDVQQAITPINDSSSALMGAMVELDQVEMTVAAVAENGIEARGIQHECARSSLIKFDFDLDLPSVVPVSSPVCTAKISTKAARRQLALAAEYIDLGDATSARALLWKIIEAGDERLCGKARGLLAKLDGLL